MVFTVVQNVDGTILTKNAHNLFTFDREQFVVSDFIWDLVRTYFIENHNNAAFKQTASAYINTNDTYLHPEDIAIVRALIPHKNNFSYLLTTSDKVKVFEFARTTNNLSILNQIICNGFIWTNTNEGWGFWNSLQTIITTLGTGDHQSCRYDARTAEIYLKFLASFNEDDMVHLSLTDSDVDELAWTLFGSQSYSD